MSVFFKLYYILSATSSFLNIQDTVLNIAYVSPLGSTVYDNLIESNGIVLLESNITDILFHYPDSYFFLVGDLNARTKDSSDYILKDDFRYIIGGHEL